MISFVSLEQRKNHGGLGDYLTAKARVTRGDIDVELTLSPPAKREIEAIVLKDTHEQLTRMTAEKWESRA